MVSKLKALLTYILGLITASNETVATLKAEIADLKVQLAEALADDADDAAAIDAAETAAAKAKVEASEALAQVADLKSKLEAATADDGDIEAILAATADAVGFVG